MRRKAVSTKSRRVVDLDLLQEIRWEPCAWCGTTQKPRQIHHIIGRGQEGHRRADTRVNCLPVCLDCHACIHSGERPIKADLIAVSAARNGLTIAQVEDALNMILWGRP